MYRSDPAPSRRPRRARTIAWAAFYLLDGLLVLLFALGYVNAYLPFDTLWWAELVAIGLPYLALLLAPAALVAALGRRWLLLGLHGTLLLLFGARLATPARLAPGPAPGPTDLTILTFNVPPGRVHPEGMRALLRDVDPEVVCLQEAGVAYYVSSPPFVRAQPYLQEVIDSTAYRSDRPQGRGDFYTPQPFFSRIPVDSVFKIVFRHEHDPKVITYVSRAELRWQGRPFVLYNLHLNSFGNEKPWHEEALLDPRLWRAYLHRYREAFRIRAWEVEQIQALLARETTPVVVCGDFNSTPFNRAYERLAAGRTDAFRAAGHGWGMTYHSRLPFARIDFVLVDPRWEVVSARGVPVHLSDHRPLVARLRWRE